MKFHFVFDTSSGYSFDCIEAKDLFHALVKVFDEYADYGCQNFSLDDPKEFEEYVAYIREEYAHGEKVTNDWLTSYLVERADNCCLLTIYVGTPIFES